ncbi:Ig-like domain-containing protein [Acinetobacter bohemicus]|uniref:BapA/Bap/LapF family large adhesin n=1 Tax=Acinetobacter TaxID=469 RepID=UPI00209B2291|nr:BapA/Bap/LapF family large adhesin [Acinetobacter bohemicus]MCO8043667.1 Ig-like domain-containing protein [Acinetobacter sp. S4400-12]MCU7225380.1 Ig-like domain-containing protein [Acinetobacter bohemicus]
MTGKGEPGSEIVVTDKDGNILGTGTVDENGDFVVPVNPALTDGNTADVIAKDEAGNESDPVEITGEKDTIAPAVPTDVVIGEDGLTVSGKAEAGSTVDVTDKNGNVIGTGTADENGDFAIELKRPVTDGEVVDVTAKDQAGNTSEPTEVTGNKDTIAPDAPDAEVGIDSVLTVKTEPNATVKVYDKDGNIIYTGQANENGDLTYTFDPALERGTELNVTATDKAGNESKPTNIKSGVGEIFATTDNDVEIILEAQPKEIVNSNPGGLNKDGFTVASVGLGPILGLDVLASVIENSVQLDVGENQVRDVTLYGQSGGVQVAGLMDLYLYKLNESTGDWELQAVKESWVVAVLLGGKSEETSFSLTEGKWMFVMGASGGLSALTGYGLRFTEDIIKDYGQAESISGGATGNMITDNDFKHGADEIPADSIVTHVQGANGEWLETSSNGEIIIQGKYGVLTVKADGSYTYKVDEEFRGYGERDVFNYRVTSPSGEISESELSFELNLTPREDHLEIDNIVLLNSEPTIKYEGESSIKDAVGFSVLDLALLGPVLDAKLLSGMNTLDFTVGENEIKELTMHGSAGGVALGVGYDLFIYKLDPETGNYNQVHLEKDWFWAVVLGGKSDPLTLQFGEGTYKAFMQSKGGLGLLTGAGIYVDHEKVYDYDEPSKFEGEVAGDATAEDSTILLKVEDQDVALGEVTIVQGYYGKLIINADGTYTYTVEKPANAPADWKPPYGKVDSFQLVMQDANGKTIIKNLNIQLGTHTASDDFNETSVNEVNEKTVIKYEESWAFGAAKKSYSQEFEIAEHEGATGAVLKVNGERITAFNDGVITYTLTNITTGEVFTRTVVGDGRNFVLDINLEKLSAGKYTLEINSQHANLRSVSFKTDEIIHSKDYIVEGDIAPITGSLLENDQGFTMLDSLKVGHKEVFVGKENESKGAESIEIEGRYGTLVVKKDGTYTYTPTGGMYGVETFTYETISKVGTIETAILEINVGKIVNASVNSDSVNSSAADDQFTMNGGADTVIFDLLSNDNTGGNGHDVWNDFSMEEGDKIEVSDLLSEGTTLADAITLTEDAEGNVVLNIDRDGTAGTSYQSESFLTLVGVEKTDTLLDDLINNGHLF